MAKNSNNDDNKFFEQNKLYSRSLFIKIKYKDSIKIFLKLYSDFFTFELDGMPDISTKSWAI